MSETIYRDPAGATGQRGYGTFLSGALPFALLIAEFAVITVSALISSALYHLVTYDRLGDFAPAYKFAVLLFVPLFILRLARKRYDPLTLANQRRLPDFALREWTGAFLAAIAISFLVREIDVLSRGAVLIFYVFGGVCITGLWYLCRSLVRAAFRRGILAGRRTMVIGTPESLLALTENYDLRPSGLQIDAHQMVALHHQSGVVEDKARLSASDTAITAAVQRIRKSSVDDVLLALPWRDHALLSKCTDALMETPVSIYYLPEPALSQFHRIEMRDIGGLNGLRVVAEPLSPLDRMIKRGFDVVASGLALIALIPVFATVAILIKATSRGPVLFRQHRTGWNQRAFRILKFRTMTVAEDGDAVVQAKPGDTRITPIGRWLRRWNLDELPQLVNVLLGHMSLVGPRPHALVHDRSFERHISLYARRHNVLPGLTGWAQVNGLRGETDTSDKMRARVEHDLYYIDHWSIWFDIKILLLTVFSKQAFENAH